jgi:hypothetical protein
MNTLRSHLVCGPPHRTASCRTTNWWQGMQRSHAQRHIGEDHVSRFAPRLPFDERTPTEATVCRSPVAVRSAKNSEAAKSGMLQNPHLHTD